MALEDVLSNPVLKRLRENMYKADLKIAEKIKAGGRYGDANIIPSHVPMETLALLYVNQSARCSAIDASLDIVNFERMQTASGQHLHSSKLHYDRENLMLLCAAANEIDCAATSAIADADLWAMTAGASVSSLSRHPLSEMQDDTVCVPYSQLGAVLQGMRGGGQPGVGGVVFQRGSSGGVKLVELAGGGLVESVQPGRGGGGVEPVQPCGERGGAVCQLNDCDDHHFEARLGLLFCVHSDGHRCHYQEEGQNQPLFNHCP
jgi:hypothetical protein